MMFGLIKKDLLLVKANFKTLVGIFIVFILMFFTGKIDITFLLPFIVVMLFISSFSYDDFNHWDGYAISFPSGRSSIVLGKYISSLLLTVVSLIFTFVFSVIASLIRNVSFDLMDHLLLFMGTFFAIVLLVSIMFPVLFKFGSEKGRIWMFIGVFGFSFVIGILSQYISFSHFDGFLHFVEMHAGILVVVISLVLLFSSYFISRRIYLKKEF